MGKPLLIVGLVLSLGSVGCAGFGLHQSSSLGGRARPEQGLDELWLDEERDPARGIEPRFYAEQELGDLWSSAEEDPQTQSGLKASTRTPSRIGASTRYADRGLDDLWE